MRLRIRDPRVLVLSAALLSAAIAFPLGAIASDTFADVPDSNTFHDDINAIAHAGVTSGCGGGNYCPKDFVTREQMAAFMNRLGALAPGKTPVVNAARLGGKSAKDFLAAADIVVNQMGPFLAKTDGLTILHGVTAITVDGLTGTREVLVPLQAPGKIGGTTYGLKSVRVCYDATVNVTIGSTQVSDTAGLGLATGIINDGTDRTAAGSGCYTVTNSSPAAPEGGIQLWLTLGFASNSTIFFGNVTSTWTPVP